MLLHKSPMRFPLFLLALFLLPAAVFPPPAAAELPASGDYIAGTHYSLITPPLRQRASGKIEVVEFFAYSCNHCYNFEPLIKQWKKTLPAYVDFQPAPVVWNAGMEAHAKAYYAAKALGALDRIHGAVFAAIHVDRKPMNSADKFRALFAANGITADDFNRAYNSFGVNNQVRQADSMTRNARITGTPELMVAGKYRISSRQTGGQAGMLKVADYLIEKEWAARQNANR